MKFRIPRKKKKERKTKGIVHGCGIWHQIKTLPYKETDNFNGLAKQLRDLMFKI